MTLGSVVVGIRELTSENSRCCAEEGTLRRRAQRLRQRRRTQRQARRCPASATLVQLLHADGRRVAGAASHVAAAAASHPASVLPHLVGADQQRAHARHAVHAVKVVVSLAALLLRARHSVEYRASVCGM